MGEKVIKGEEISYDFITVVDCDSVVEPGVWKWKGILRCHSYFRFDVVRLCVHWKLKGQGRHDKRET